MTDRIGFYSRDDKYGWLSNFHRCDQVVDGLIYPTNEHYYQAQKAISPEFRRWIRLAPNPYLAMKSGRLLRAGKEGELRPDWEAEKLSIMEIGTRAKYCNQALRLRLLQTENAYLFENSPTDDFWGGYLPNSKNHLGNIIMKIRAEIAGEFK
jgi:N-glycosidase YbiA